MSPFTQEELAEREAVRAIVSAVPHEIDQRRWPELRALFADTIVADYTSLFGGEVKPQPGDELIEGWRTALSPLSATQHLLGPIHVTLRGRDATATCHVRAWHFRPATHGGDEWMVSGHYVFELTRRDARWEIARMKLVTFYQSGNTALLAEAQRASAGGQP